MEVIKKKPGKPGIGRRRRRRNLRGYEVEVREKRGEGKRGGSQEPREVWLEMCIWEEKFEREG